MEILGIGPSELLLIVVLALIILGPRDMQKAGRSIGRWLHHVVTSDGWKLFQQTSREIRSLPTTLMREAAIEELQAREQNPRGAIKESAAPGSAASPEAPLGPSVPAADSAEPSIRPPSGSAGSNLDGDGHA